MDQRLIDAVKKNIESRKAIEALNLEKNKLRKQYEALENEYNALRMTSDQVVELKALQQAHIRATLAECMQEYEMEVDPEKRAIYESRIVILTSKLNEEDFKPGTPPPRMHR